MIWLTYRRVLKNFDKKEFAGVSLGFHWGFIGASLGFHWGFIGASLGFHWGFVGFQANLQIVCELKLNLTTRGQNTPNWGLIQPKLMQIRCK